MQLQKIITKNIFLFTLKDTRKLKKKQKNDKKCETKTFG